MSKKDKSLIQEVRDTDQYQTFKKIFSRIREKLDFEKSRKEALSLHSSRTSRELYADKQYSLKKLMDATLKDLSFRSRMVEMRVQASIQLSTLDEALKSARRFVSTEYDEELREFSTSDQRRDFVNRILKNAVEFNAEGQALIELLDQLIKDIDQSSHQLRHLIDCLKLLDSSKGKVV